MSSELQRAVGRIEATLDTVAVDVTTLKTEVAALVAASNVAKGAKRATYAIAGAIGGGVSLVITVAGFFLK